MIVLRQRWSEAAENHDTEGFLHCRAGRDDVEVEYDVGFDGDGRLLGLRMRVRLLGGWAQDLATDDGVILKDAAGMVRATRSATRTRCRIGYSVMISSRVRTWFTKMCDAARWPGGRVPVAPRCRQGVAPYWPGWPPCIFSTLLLALTAAVV